MLVLNRKKSDRIVIRVGDEIIEIKILDTTKAHVKIGIDAPQHMQIMRGEVWDNRMPDEDIERHVAWYGGGKTVPKKIAACSTELLCRGEVH